MFVTSWPMLTSADHAVHRVGMVHLERVVQREGIDVDDRRR